MDAQPTAQDQPDDDDGGAFAAIVARINLDDVDEQSTTRAAPPEPEQKPTAAATVVDDPTPAGHRPAPVEPAAPTPPERPTFPLRRLQGVGLAMTVGMAAVGQIAFWSGFFGSGPAAIVGAVAIAAAFEVLMIGATDSALDHKAAGSRWWRLLFPVGALAALVASGVQLLHWELSMGVPFAAASLIGWGAHAASGWIKAHHYVAERAAYDAEVQRQRAKTEARADAEYEQRQAVAPAPPAPEPEPAPETTPAPNPVKATPAAKSKAKSPTKGRTFDQATARERLGDEFDRLGPAEINRRMAALGYDTVNPSTIRRWRR